MALERSNSDITAFLTEFVYMTVIPVRFGITAAEKRTSIVNTLHLTVHGYWCFITVVTSVGYPFQLQ
jgi:hypothetical protein